jgi:peptidoglycan/xylan/chitin deacetylase (PgdA/CDA1 family)
LQQDLFIKEIEDNRESIRRMTGVSPHHFCYPNGKFNPKLVAWLNEIGVSSATTCSPLLATQKTNKFAIPRLVDTSNLSAVAFEGWVCGLASLLARANYRMG